jgi:hypothetical protein
MRGAAGDRVRRLILHGCLSLSSAPRWLAAEFVWATCPGCYLARNVILQTQCQSQNKCPELLCIPRQNRWQASGK